MTHTKFGEGVECRFVVGVIRMNGWKSTRLLWTRIWRVFDGATDTIGTNGIIGKVCQDSQSFSPIERVTAKSRPAVRACRGGVASKIGRGKARPLEEGPASEKD
ncbi:MAG TPA: hypothetical protein VHE81_14240 [Lacipirellulaceae bacterium]|nr:hypothetical protein [Lacipirellulaceae bacterium]